MLMSSRRPAASELTKPSPTVPQHYYTPLLPQLPLPLPHFTTTTTILRTMTPSLDIIYTCYLWCHHPNTTPAIILINFTPQTMKTRYLYVFKRNGKIIGGVQYTSDDTTHEKNIFLWNTFSKDRRRRLLFDNYAETDTRFRVMWFYIRDSVVFWRQNLKVCVFTYDRVSKVYCTPPIFYPLRWNTPKCHI